MLDLIGKPFGQHGQYMITALLGEGGMAAVFRAQQLSVKRDVAIKVIKTGLLNMGEFVRRFEREAETVAALDHIHILKVFDYGQQGDMVYLVMQLLSGGSLADLIARSGGLSVTQAAKLLDQMAAALDYAHGQSIVHRDMKPHNVLLDQQGNAFLTDFGIAKLRNTSGTALTQSGGTLGTPAYMSPEQWRGEAVDARADIYALGIILFEMLTGRVPFEGDTAFGLMHKHVYEPIPPVRDIKPDLPLSVERVINKALAKDKEQRFESAGALAAAFRQAISDDGWDENRTPEAVIAAPRSTRHLTTPSAPVAESAPEPPSTARRTNLPILLLAAVLVLALIGVGAILLSQNNAAAEATNTAQTLIAAQATQTAAAPTLTAVPSATATLTPSATASATASPTATPTATLTATATATHTATPTVTATLTVSPTLTHTPTDAPTATPLPLPTAFGGGSSRIIFTTSRDGNQEIYSIEANGRSPRNLTRDPFDDYSPAFSPDGTRIVFVSTRGGGRQLFIMDADGGNVQRLTRERAENYDAAWSPDGKQIVYVSTRDRRRNIYLISTASGDLEDPIRLTDVQATDERPLFSPDGTQIAFISDRSGTRQVWLMNADGSNPRQLTQPPATVRYFAWSPDGTQIVISQNRGENRAQLYLMPAAPTANDAMQRLTNDLGNHIQPVWTADGQHIIYLSNFGLSVAARRYNLWIVDRQGGDAHQLTRDTLDNIPDSRIDWQP
ncbi:MAG: hypothetical protein DYG88_05890 [Chloroflexi bacterium CFX4]|nr:hypothetical protein [Chloroflexi bacterium CFX4]MDL1922857.1 hypothetical protein [Chloroflexi bacterium CFX3]